MHKIILSSTSPSRRMLLERLMIPFETFSPDIDETALANETPENLVERLAINKAKTALNIIDYKNALIIGADQVGAINDIILNKPLTHENAVKQLQLVSGKKIRFYTGLCLYDVSNDITQYDCITYDVHFRQLTSEVIHGYLLKEKPYACAGSFHVEGLGITLIEKLAGDDYTALIGLPLIRLTDMLERVRYII